MAKLHLAQEILDIIYPVGSVYISVNTTNPSTLFGGGWTRITGRFLLGADDNTYKNGATGGEATHKLTVSEMPKHKHTISGGKHNHRLPTNLSDKVDPGNLDYFNYDGWAWGSYYNLTRYDGDHSHDCSIEGGDTAHNNMPPYLVVYMWKRTS